MRLITRFALPLSTLSCALAIPEGLEIHEFAGPPNADYPAGISVAPNGDVYVSSDQNGSLGKQKDMGRIIRCRDTDGDGKADQFIHFIPKIDSPRGGDFVAGTFYLIHPPYLTAYRDTNGDGVSDQEKLLVTGLGGGIEHPRGADHTTNGVRMGIDGWLYISVGDFGMADAKSADGSRYTLHGGGVVRVRPDGSELEPYALMTRNICDTAISPTLDLFSRDNTNDGKGWNTRFHHYTALGDHGYPRLYQHFSDEAIVPLADYGGGSGTGSLWLSEPGFPGDFGNMLYSCDWTTGNIYYHPSKRDGASFTIEQKQFEKLPNATDIDVDGFSRLYLADWRGGSFNYANGKPVGMIHQVTIKNGKGAPAKFEEPAKADDPRLIELLASASAVQRLEAQQEIVKRGAKPAFATSILALAKDSKQSIEVRVAAIFTLKQLFGADANRPLATLVADSTVREYALRAMTDRRSQLAGVSPKLYTDALRDADPRVVLQAIIGLQRLNAKDAAPDILAASSTWNETSHSPRLIHTATAALVSLGNVPALLQAAGATPTRTIALRSLERLHQMPVVNGLLRLIGSSSDADLRYDSLLALARLHFDEKPWDLKSWWNTRPDDRGPYYELNEWEGTAKIHEALEKGFGMIPAERQGAFLERLALNRIPVSELKLAGLDPILTALGTTALSNDQVALLLDAAKDPKRPFAKRLECYRALSRAPGNQAMPARIAVLGVWSVEKSPPAEVARETDDFINETERALEIPRLRAIAAKQSNAVSRIAWKTMLTILNSPLSKPPWKEQVRKFVDENPREVGFFEALADLRLQGFDKQIEVGMNYDNEELIHAAQAAKAAVAGAAGGGKKVGDLPVADVMKAAMKAAGDVADGKRLFTAQGCIACHAVDPKAEQKGPFLGSSGSKFTRDYLIESILDPNKAVAQGFQTSVFTMKDGGVKMGFVTSEADGLVEVRNIAGQVEKLKRAEVSKEEHQTQSMMPPGLAAGLTVEEFSSLIQYLSSLKAIGG